MKTLATLIGSIALFVIVSFQTIPVKSVKIGKQTWTTENLNTGKFRNGDNIPEAKTNLEWETAGNEKKPAWCYYNNDPANAKKYGKLYNWYAVKDARGLAPEGYHIASTEEWDALSSYLANLDFQVFGIVSNEGKRMKALTG